jgi:DNA-binding transcriptional regulator YhcF (GntR family)
MFNNNLVDFPSLVITQGDLPIYLQLKYQLVHLISSGVLKEGYQLPPVRALAEHLDINPGTVAQTYKELQGEGLIEGKKGRGSFVLPTTNPNVADYAIRHQLLTSTLRQSLQWAYALGFGDVEIQQSMSSLLSGESIVRKAVFVGHTSDGSQKYAEHITRYLSEFQLDLAALTVESLESNESNDILEQAYYVFTYAGLIQRVDAALKTKSRPYRIVGIVVEVTEETILALSHLDPHAKTILLTKERYVHGALNLIQRYSRVAIENITTIYENTDWQTDLLLNEADTVLYTFSMHKQVTSLSAKERQRFVELKFDISSDSLEKLKRMLTPATRPTWLGTGQAS